MGKLSIEGFHKVIKAPLLKGKLFREMDRIDGGSIEIEAIGIRLLPEGIEKKMTYEGPFPFYRSDVKMGIPVAQVISNEYLDYRYWDKSISPADPSSEPSILINCEIYQLKDPNKQDILPEDTFKSLQIGLEGLLKLGEEEIPVFICPVHE